MKSFRLDIIFGIAVAFLLFAASPLFAASASFGEAVSNPDPWQNALGALILFVAQKFLLPRFPALQWLLDMLLPKPVDPSNPPAPIDPVTPAPPEKERPLAELLKLLLAALTKKRQEVAEIEAALAAAKT